MRIRMCAHVVVEVGQLLKSPPTFLTLMRFLAGVCVMVDTLVDFVVETLSAKIALVRFVLRVGFDVRAQIGRTVESFVTL